MSLLKKKKIALLTCFLDNYGACLQALALQKVIENFGADCNIIAYIEPLGYYKSDFSVSFKERIKEELWILMKSLKRKQLPKRQILHHIFKEYRDKYLKFEHISNTNKIKAYCSFDELKNISENYDAFVCGSDQIWNPTFYAQNNPAYFLRFAGEKQRIAYAPSIGLPKLPDEYIETFIAYINDFDYVSVREKQGAEIIKSLCNRDAKVVLDPTLLIGRDFWLTLLDNRYKKPHKQYIFCYIFSDKKKYCDYLKKIQERTNLPIIYINVSNLSYDGLHAQKKEFVDPLEFLQLLKNATFVVTDSFHGTAFSILLKKDFYVLKRERRGETIDMFSRIENILSCVQLENRTVSINEPFEIKKSIDYTVVDKNLEHLRKSSLEFLQNALMDD